MNGIVKMFGEIQLSIKCHIVNLTNLHSILYYFPSDSAIRKYRIHCLKISLNCQIIESIIVHMTIELCDVISN